MMPFRQSGNAARPWELGSPYWSPPWSRFPCGALSCGSAISFGRVGLDSAIRAVPLDFPPRVYLSNLDRWQRLIEDSDVSALRRVMTGLDTDSVQMREVSPMGGLLPHEERVQVLRRAG